MISAPSLDKPPLPTTELLILQLSWLGIFTAHGVSSNSNNSLQNRGPCHPWRYQVNIEGFAGEEGERNKPDHFEDLNENILLRVAIPRLGGTMAQVSLPIESWYRSW